jgi:GNAT superfamily N-acetyltransferase
MPAIREATVDDAEAIALVHVASWRAAYRGLVPDAVLDGLSVGHRTKNWTDWLGRDPSGRWALEGLGAVVASSSTWVAEESASAVGFVNAGPSRDDDATERTGEVHAIYALEDVWGSGVGAALMRTATSWLRQRYACATLWVLEGNSRGRRFYDKGGWKPDGASQMLDFAGTKLQEVRYRLDF